MSLTRWPQSHSTSANLVQGRRLWLFVFGLRLLHLQPPNFCKNYSLTPCQSPWTLWPVLKLGISKRLIYSWCITVHFEHLVEMCFFFVDICGFYRDCQQSVVSGALESQDLCGFFLLTLLAVYCVTAVARAQQKCPSTAFVKYLWYYPKLNMTVRQF
jgi:hypothetical protein